MIEGGTVMLLQNTRSLTQSTRLTKRGTSKQTSKKRKKLLRMTLHLMATASLWVRLILGKAFALLLSIAEVR